MVETEMEVKSNLLQNALLRSLFSPIHRISIQISDTQSHDAVKINQQKAQVDPSVDRSFAVAFI